MLTPMNCPNCKASLDGGPIPEAIAETGQKRQERRMRQFEVVRDVTTDECRWLSGETVKAGEKVYEFTGCTYGCIGTGMAVSREPGGTPFFELPRDALRVTQ